MAGDRYTPDEVDAIVRAELLELVSKSGKPVPVLADDLRLDADLGLSSLDVTTLLVALTDRIDPALGETVTSDVDIATVGDLRRAFDPAASRRTADEGGALAASRRRAEARRASGR
jgi:hypothetical protein